MINIYSFNFYIFEEGSYYLALPCLVTGYVTEPGSKPKCAWITGICHVWHNSYFKHWGFSNKQDTQRLLLLILNVFLKKRYSKIFFTCVSVCVLPMKARREHPEGTGLQTVVSPAKWMLGTKLISLCKSQKHS